MIEWDISDTSIIEKKYSEVLEKIGTLDILINNAGIYTNQRFFDSDEKTFDNVYSTNIKGLYFLTQYFSNDLLKNKKQGKIINIVSNRSIQGAVGSYGLSKWGLLGLTRGLGKELINKGIIVNGISPGVTATGINNINPFDNAYCSSSGDFRVGICEEMAEIALFLCSNAANHIVGQVIVCDGGESLI